MADDLDATTPPRVTAAMIEAAVVAEFECYYPDRRINEFAWSGTPRMVIKKMIEAALREAVNAE